MSALLSNILGSSTFEMLPLQKKGPNGTLVGGRPTDGLTNSGIYQTLTPLSTDRYFMIGPLLAGDGRNGKSLQLLYKGWIPLAWLLHGVKITFPLNRAPKSPMGKKKDSFWW